MKLKAGDNIVSFSSIDTTGNNVSTDDYRGKKFMISFFRYAECLFCNLRMHELIKIFPELEKEGLNIIAIFQSPAEDIDNNIGKLNPPFPLIPNRDRSLYKQYGVTIRNPLGLYKGYMQWGKALHAFSKGHFVKVGKGSRSLIPADFLVNEDHTIHTAFYATDISEHLPMRQIQDFLK